jgi:hypothetical protein
MNKKVCISCGGDDYSQNEYSHADEDLQLYPKQYIDGIPSIEDVIVCYKCAKRLNRLHDEKMGVKFDDKTN